MMAIAAQAILLAALGGGTVACIGGMAASPRQYGKGPPGHGRGQWPRRRTALAIGRMASGAGWRFSGACIAFTQATDNA
jgi:hypothetical protein